MTYDERARCKSRGTRFTSRALRKFFSAALGSDQTLVASGFHRRIVGSQWPQATGSSPGKPRGNHCRVLRKVGGSNISGSPRWNCACNLRGGRSRKSRACLRSFRRRQILNRGQYENDPRVRRWLCCWGDAEQNRLATVLQATEPTKRPWRAREASVPTLDIEWTDTGERQIVVSGDGFAKGISAPRIRRLLLGSRSGTRRGTHICR